MHVLISVLTYRKDSGVERCLDSVVKAGGDYSLCLTDNGGDVGDFFERWMEKNPGVSCMVKHHKKNLGFKGGNEVAYQTAQRLGFDYLITLNDDATVPRGWLEAIESEFDRYPAAAIVGSRSGCRTLNKDFHGYVGSALEYIEGSCACYKLSVWKKCFKSFYPEWLTFCYAEDSSISLEVRKLGYSIHQARFQIDHVGAATSSKVPAAKMAQLKNHTIALERYAHYMRHRTFAYRIVTRRIYSAGDVLLLTPVIRQLWKENPQCEIVAETNFPEIFTGNPCVTMAAKKIERHPTDLELDFDMVSENAPMRHFVTSYARMAGVDVKLPCRTEIYWRDDPFAALDWAGDWVALHTGPSTWISKEWSAGHWNTLAIRLLQDGWKVLLVGNGKLKDFCMGGSRDMRDRTKSLNDLAALLSHCQLFIGIDSFPMHCASAVGVPTVGIFGITDSRFILTSTNSVGVNADPLKYPNAGMRHRVAGLTTVYEDGTTINSITVDQVLAAANKICHANKNSTAV